MAGPRYGYLELYDNWSASQNAELYHDIVAPIQTIPGRPPLNGYPQPPSPPRVLYPSLSYCSPRNLPGTFRGNIRLRDIVEAKIISTAIRPPEEVPRTAEMLRFLIKSGNLSGFCMEGYTDASVSFDRSDLSFDLECQLPFTKW